MANNVPDKVCSGCHSLLLNFHHAVEDPTLKYWLSDLFESKRCPLCRLILTTLALEPSVAPLFRFRERNMNPIMFSFHNFTMLRRSKDNQEKCEDEIRWLHIDHWNSSFKTFAFIQCLKAGSNDYLLGREVKDRLNMPLVRSWIQNCSNTHHSLCSSRLVRHGAPRLVIDVQAKMVVPVPDSCQYAALSYVWGARDVPQLKLTQATQSRLRIAGGLHEKWTDIPRTIADAILLCEQLSIHYLWVDALCIEQDSQTNSDGVIHPEIGQMDQIYGAAHLTIVGAAGDSSWAGLPGLRKASRTVLQHREQVDSGYDLVLANVLPPMRSVIQSTVWNSRGWTFQEKVLSKRLLIFTDQQVFWSCNSRRCCEDIRWEKDPNVNSDEQWQNRLFRYMDLRGMNSAFHSHEKHGVPLFECYAELLKDYTSRSFTHQDDVLLAFGGILSTLETEFATSFLFGIPIQLFEHAICFYSGSYIPRYRRPGFPSWSWAGWDQSGRAGIVNSRLEDCHLEVAKSINAWYSFSNGSGDSVTVEHIVGIKYPGARDLLENSPCTRQITLPTDINPAHILVFDAETCYLAICRHIQGKHQNSDDEQYSLYIPATTSTFQGQSHSHQFPAPSCWNTPIGSLRLDSSWRKSIGDTIEFVAILKEEYSRYDPAQEGEWSIRTLAIETDSRGISQRIHAFTIEASHWELARPKKRTVYLI